jgi:hypothetical protein
MARTIGPLFSVDASGSVAKTIVFSKWKGRNYVRRHAYPAQPRSGKQVSMRAMLKFLTQTWAAIDPGDQAGWEPRAAQSAVSPFNAYVGYNQQSWRNFLPPTKVDPPTRAAAAVSDLAAFAATAGERQITLSGTFTPAQHWGFAIFRDTVATPTPSISNLIAIAPAGASPMTFVDTPLAPGTYYYKVLSLGSIGGLMSAGVDDDATVV